MIKVIKIHREHEFVPLLAIGILTQRYYDGYPVFCLSFRWLVWGVSFLFGVQRDDDMTEDED